MIRYEVARSTIDGVQKELFASATIAYADTNEHALGAVKEVEYYKNLVAEFKVTTLSNTTGQTLTFGLATSNYQLTGANAIAELASAYWSPVAITLATGADVFYYKITIPAEEINGKYLYSKYAYGADPTGAPTIEAKISYI